MDVSESKEQKLESLCCVFTYCSHTARKRFYEQLQSMGYGLADLRARPQDSIFDNIEDNDSSPGAAAGPELSLLSELAICNAVMEQGAAADDRNNCSSSRARTSKRSGYVTSCPCAEPDATPIQSQTRENMQRFFSALEKSLNEVRNCTDACAHNSDLTEHRIDSYELLTMESNTSCYCWHAINLPSYAILLPAIHSSSMADKSHVRIMLTSCVAKDPAQWEWLPMKKFKVLRNPVKDAAVAELYSGQFLVLKRGCMFRAYSRTHQTRMLLIGVNIEQVVPSSSRQVHAAQRLEWISLMTSGDLLASHYASMVGDADTLGPLSDEELALLEANAQGSEKHEAEDAEQKHVDSVLTFSNATIWERVKVPIDKLLL